MGKVDNNASEKGAEITEIVRKTPATRLAEAIEDGKISGKFNGTIEDPQKGLIEVPLIVAIRWAGLHNKISPGQSDVLERECLQSMYQAGQQDKMGRDLDEAARLSIPRSGTLVISGAVNRLRLAIRDVDNKEIFDSYPVKDHNGTVTNTVCLLEAIFIERNQGTINLQEAKVLADYCLDKIIQLAIDPNQIIAYLSKLLKKDLITDAEFSNLLSQIIQDPEERIQITTEVLASSKTTQYKPATTPKKDTRLTIAIAVAAILAGTFVMTEDKKSASPLPERIPIPIAKKTPSPSEKEASRRTIFFRPPQSNAPKAQPVITDQAEQSMAAIDTSTQPEQSIATPRSIPLVASKSSTESMEKAATTEESPSEAKITLPVISRVNAEGEAVVDLSASANFWKKIGFGVTIGNGGQVNIYASVNGKPFKGMLDKEFKNNGLEEIELLLFPE